MKTVEVDVSTLNTQFVRPKSKNESNRVSAGKVYMNSKIDNVFNQVFQQVQNPYIQPFNRVALKTMNEATKMIPFFANRKSINTNTQFRALYQPQIKSLKIAQTLRNKTPHDHQLSQLHLTNKSLLPQRLDSKPETRYSSLPRHNNLISGGS